MLKLKEFFKKYRLLAAVFFGILGLGVLCHCIWLARERTIVRVKKEIVKIGASLNEIGYDISYDSLKFGNIPPFDILTVENLKFYKLSEADYVEWSIPYLTVNTGFFNADSLAFGLSPEQYVMVRDEKYKLDMPSLSFAMDLAPDVGIKSIKLLGKELGFGDVLRVGELKFASRRMSSGHTGELAPLLESYLEISGVEFLQSYDFAISKNLEKLYLNANIVGKMNREPTYEQSIGSWLKLGGMVEVKKLILNWDYFNLVGKGDLYFTEDFSPKMHLNTSSKGLIKTMDLFQDRGVLDSKGVFVAKILLNNKSFALNEGDVYKTVTTPIDVSAEEMTVENISIKKFPVSKEPAKQEEAFKINRISHALDL